MSILIFVDFFFRSLAIAGHSNSNMWHIILFIHGKWDLGAIFLKDNLVSIGAFTVHKIIFSLEDIVQLHTMIFKRKNIYSLLIIYKIFICVVYLVHHLVQGLPKQHPSMIELFKAMYIQILSNYHLLRVMMDKLHGMVFDLQGMVMGLFIFKKTE